MAWAQFDGGSWSGSSDLLSFLGWMGLQAAEGDQQPAEAERVILVLDAQLVETGVEPASTEEAGPILPEGNEDAHSRGEWPEAGVGRPEVQPKVIPAMPLDLSDLYLELAK
eukprot:m.369783 g.369783  ORF g.369783 m.369783 type:complete len:111 (+) comp56118_c0_seq35:693-1025(+)